MSKVGLAAYEDEWSFSLLDNCIPGSKIGTRSLWEVKNIDLSKIISNLVR